MRIISAVLFSILIILTSSPKGNGVESEIVQKFMSADPGQVWEYTSIRDIEAHTKFLNLSAKMKVEVNLFRENNLEYKVLSESGSAKVKSRILSILKEEKKVIKKLKPETTEFNGRNYTVTPKNTTKDGFIVLWSKPLRKDHFLIDGDLFVTPSGELVRLEGKLVKDPSRWTNNVRVVREYQRIAGIRMLVKQSSKADLILGIGESSLEAEYVYTSVNGTRVAEVK